MRDFLEPFDVPMTVEVVEGEVVVLGPSGMAVALTPQAARISAERLRDAAQRADPGTDQPEPDCDALAQPQCRLQDRNRNR